MFNKKKKQKDFFISFSKEIKAIFQDVIFVYKNFLHWNISKVIVSLWSILLGIICMLPFVVISSIAGFIDPIPWLDIFSSQDIDNDIMLSGLAMHPFWLILMTFLMCVSLVFFLLGSSYGTFLLAKLSLKYTHKKTLDYKKNEYFSKPFITTYIALISWNFLYLLAPVAIWGGIVFFLYLLYNSAIFNFSILSYSIVVCTIILIAVLSYVAYRILFGYMILAEEKKSNKISPAKSYLYASIKLTQGKSFWKFLFIAILYTILLAPFNALGDYFTSESENMRDALAYKARLIENIDANEIDYYEYITKEYEAYTEEDLVAKIVLFSRLKIFHFFVGYFLFGGIMIFIISSFYRRVLLQK